jgi:hypothetical protein
MLKYANFNDINTQKVHNFKHNDMNAALALLFAASHQVDA